MLKVRNCGWRPFFFIRKKHKNNVSELFGLYLKDISCDVRITFFAHKISSKMLLSSTPKMELESDIVSRSRKKLTHVNPLHYNLLQNTVIYCLHKSSENITHISAKIGLESDQSNSCRLVEH